MNSFETWQVSLGIVQATLSLAVFLGALYIGFKQNEINQNLLELNYAPSLEVTYSNNRFNIINKSKTDIMLWATKIGSGPRSIESEPRIITPEGSYYLFTDGMNVTLAAGSETTGPFEIYFETSQRKKYTAKLILYFRRTKDALEVHTQLTGLIQGDWSK